VAGRRPAEGGDPQFLCRSARPTETSRGGCHRRLKANICEHLRKGSKGDAPPPADFARRWTERVI